MTPQSSSEGWISSVPISSVAAWEPASLAIRRPELVRRLAVASLAYDKEGFHADIVENIESTDAEDFAGSIFQEAYAKVAPNPQN
jgi:hypothetical protein